MFTRLISLLQLRRSTAFLLARADDRLLDDIGLTRADLQQLCLGLPAPASAPRRKASALRRTLPVAG